MVAQQRIVQIIDAKGWVAVYDRGTGDVDVIHTKPLVCWALVEEGASSRVIGLDADAVANVRESGAFLGYAKEGENLGRFKRREVKPGV